MEEESEAVENFAELGVGEELAKAFERLGWSNPTKIQVEALAYALKGKDVIGPKKIQAEALPYALEGKGSRKRRPKVGLLYDDRMCKHDTPNDAEDHPECPNRIKAIWEMLHRTGHAQRCVVLGGSKAEDRHLQLVHTKKHVDLVKSLSTKKKDSRRNKIASKFDSVYLNGGSSEAAYLAAGSVVEVAEKVAEGELDCGFAIVRPPGHHAEEDEAMGFCLFNNVAVAASYLLNERPDLGIRKILIVDWDVHHGNGTQKMFWKDPRVLVFSVHRHDDGNFYPTGDDGDYDKVGEGPGEGFNINVPWEKGRSGDADYLAVWEYILIPVTKDFNPDIILLSAGFDAAIGDPLGGCFVTPYGYSLMLQELMEFAQGKIVMALEGGYNLDSVAKSSLACVQVLLEDKPIQGPPVEYPLEATGRVIQAVRKRLCTYWPSLADESLLGPPPDGSDEEVEAMQPRMHFLPDQYNKSIKVPTRCFVQEVVATFKKVGLTNREREWFENHPQFRHIIHMPISSHMLQPMWMLLLRTADVKRRKEAWFVVNGVPIRYGIREHALISGLDCKLLPADWNKKGSDAFKKKYFDDGAKVLRTEVKKKLEAMAPDDTDDRLRMAVLYFLSSIIYCPSKTGEKANAVEDLFLSYVADLDLCQTFPWGRYSYDRMVESIRNTMNHYGGTATVPYVFPGFCIPLELLALEAIPQLRESMRQPVEAPFDDCPRMCRYKWKKPSAGTGFPLEHVYKKLGEDNQDIESLLIATEAEKERLAEIVDSEDVGDCKDPVVESWEKRLRQGYTVAFEDMRAADVAGRAAAGVGKVPGAKKPVGKVPGAKEPMLDDDVISALETITEQLRLVMQQIEKMDGRLKRVEEDVAGLKGNL